MKHRFLIYFIVIVNLLASNSLLFGATNEKRGIVLIIANAKYSEVADVLPNAVNDGKRIEKTFKELKYDVIIRTNLKTQDDINNSLNQFADKAKDKKYETAIVYYTGHGMSANTRNGTENYLIPTKAAIYSTSDIGNKCPTLSSVQETLIKTGCKNKILFFDACRSLESLGKSSVSNSIATKTYDSIWVFYSAAQGQKAFDGPKGENSPFCEALDTFLTVPNLNVAELGNRISNYVVNYCNVNNINGQTPVLQQWGPMNISLNPIQDTLVKDNNLSSYKRYIKKKTEKYVGIGYGSSGYDYPYLSIGVNLNNSLPVLENINLEVDCAFPYKSETSVYWMPQEGTNSLSGVWDYKKEYILFTEIGYRIGLNDKKRKNMFLTPQIGVSMEQYEGDSKYSTEYSLQHTWSLFLNARIKYDLLLSNHFSLFGIAHYDIFPFKMGDIAQTLDNGADLIRNWNQGLYIKGLSLIFGVNYTF